MDKEQGEGRKGGIYSQSQDPMHVAVSLGLEGWTMDFIFTVDSYQCSFFPSSNPPLHCADEKQSQVMICQCEHRDGNESQVSQPQGSELDEAYG